MMKPAKNSEVRIIDPETGGAKGSKLARYDLIPVMPLEKLAEQYGRGATKYDDRNWERGYKWSLSYAAAQRHLNAFWAGEDWDDEWPDDQSLPHHLDAAIFHLMALREFSGKGTGTDDRATHARRNTDQTHPNQTATGLITRGKQAQTGTSDLEQGGQTGTEINRERQPSWRFSFV